MCGAGTAVFKAIPSANPLCPLSLQNSTHFSLFLLVRFCGFMSSCGLGFDVVNASMRQNSTQRYVGARAVVRLPHRSPQLLPQPDCAHTGGMKGEVGGGIWLSCISESLIYSYSAVLSLPALVHGQELKPTSSITLITSSNFSSRTIPDEVHNRGPKLRCRQGPRERGVRRS
jgi:hypothetical protein